MSSRRTTDSMRIAGFSALQIGFIGLLGVLGLLAGGFLSGRGEETASATTPILLNPLDGNPFRPSNRGEELVNLETEAQAVRSTEVAELVKENLGTDASTEELIEAIEVSVPVNTQILEITATDPDGKVAEQTSQAFADAYLSVRSGRAQTRTDEQVAQIVAEIDKARSELVAVADNRAVVDDDSAQASVLDQQIAGLAEQINALETRKSELAGVPVDPGQVVTNAAIESAGPLSSPLVLPLAGLLGGLGVGFVIVLVRAQTDERIGEPVDVHGAGLEVIGTLGWWDNTRSDHDDALERLRDEVRRLCVTVLAMEKRRPLSLLMAPGGDSRHFSAFATETAMAFARGGFRTLVLDTTGTLRVPQQDASAFDPIDTSDQSGLSEVVMGEVPLSEAIQQASARLEWIGPGANMKSASDLLLGEPMSRMVKDAKDLCDVLLVIDASASGSTAQALATAVDAVLIEIEEGSITRRELDSVRRSVELLDTELLGAVFIGRRGADLVDEFELEVHRRALPAAPLALFKASEGAPGSAGPEGTWGSTATEGAPAGLPPAYPAPKENGHPHTGSLRPDGDEGSGSELEPGVGRRGDHPPASQRSGST